MAVPFCWEAHVQVATSWEFMEGAQEGSYEAVSALVSDPGGFCWGSLHALFATLVPGFPSPYQGMGLTALAALTPDTQVRFSFLTFDPHNLISQFSFLKLDPQFLFFNPHLHNVKCYWI